MPKPEQTIIDSVEKPRSLAGDWIVALALFALLMIVAGISYHFARETGQSGPKWITGLFLVFGVGYISRVTLQTLNAMKFGRIRLHLRNAPVTIGGVLEGEVEFPKRATSLSNVAATLACVRVKWHATGGSGAFRAQEDIWTGYKKLEVVVRGLRGSAAVRFDVPANQPDSTVSSSKQGFVAVAETIDHGWELRLRAAAPGLDLERTFRINVAARGFR